MTPEELKRLLDIVCTGDKNAVREAGKAIKKMRYKFPNNSKELLDVYVKAIPSFDDLKNSENQAMFASLLSIFGWYDRKTISSEFTDFAFHAMQNKNGQVREMARRGADTLRIFMFDDNKTAKQLLTAHLERIEALLPKHKTAGSAKNLEDLPVSVYKTLIHYWWDSVRGKTGGDIGSFERAKKMKLPVPQYLDEEWHEQEENQVDYEKERDRLWHGKKDGDPKRAETFLQDLDERARAYFQKNLADFKISHTAIHIIEAQLKKDGNDDAAPMILMKLVGDAIKYTKGMPDLSKMNPLVRGFQFFLNHRLQKRNDGKPFSELLIQCIVEREMGMRHVPSNMEEFVEKISKTHDEIDAFVKVAAKTRNERFSTKELQSIMSEYIERAKKNDSAFCESAHYAFDWFAQIEPWSVSKRTPKELTAIAYYIVGAMNTEAGRNTGGYDNKELASFGGWKTTSSLDFTAKYAFKNVRNAMSDPDLLLISENENEKYLENDDFLIGSPLGTKDNMFRYFAVLSTEYGFDRVEWERLEKAINEAEEEKLLKLENIEHHDEYALVQALFPMSEAPGKVLDNIIISANGNKPFLRFHYLITNTHRPRISEIREYLSGFEE